MPVCTARWHGGRYEEPKRHRLDTEEGCIKEVSFRQCGVQNVIDVVKVQHASGGISEPAFKSYEQGNVKFQGVSRHGVWLDEEPTDQMIFTEAQTRTIDKSGMVLFTRTPLFGMSDVIRHFVDGGPGIYYSTATWDESPHLDVNERERLLKSFPEHERETRAKGVPMMGSGGVYPVPDEEMFAIHSQYPATSAAFVESTSASTTQPRQHGSHTTRTRTRCTSQTATEKQVRLPPTTRKQSIPVVTGFRRLASRRHDP